MVKSVLAACAIGIAVFSLSVTAIGQSLERPKPGTQTLDPRRLQMPAQPELRRDIVKHSCASEGYECADGYVCEFIMSKNGENSLGQPQPVAQRTNRFYKCNLTRNVARKPTCTYGVPAGMFTDGLGRDLTKIPSGVRQYFCQIVN